MRYKETFEYAFDLLDHFYRINILFIEEHDKNDIEIHVPTEIYKLLACRERGTGTIVFPPKFKGIDLVQYDGSTIEYVEKQK